MQFSNVFSLFKSPERARTDIYCSKHLSILRIPRKCSTNCGSQPQQRAGGQDDVSLNKLPQIVHRLLILVSPFLAEGTHLLVHANLELSTGKAEAWFWST